VVQQGLIPLERERCHAKMAKTNKEGRALRTETTINDTRDFAIGKRLLNLPALREIGFKANWRLLGVQRLDHDPITGTRDLHTLTDPVTTATGTRVPGLRLGQQRSHALLSALLIFRLQPAGFANRDLREITAQLRGLPPQEVSAGQMTYDLRRLRTHGLIAKIVHTHRYQVTDHGLHTGIVPDPRPRPPPAYRPGPARRGVHTPPTAHRRDRLPNRDRRPHQRNRSRLMTTAGAPRDET
jgi:hypothetical protein